MRYRTLGLLALLISAAPAAYAQSAADPAPEGVAAQPAPETSPTLQQRLMPESAVQLLARPQVNVAESAEPQPAELAMRPRGSGTGLIIAGGALFVAGLLIGGDAGTVVAVAGAALGAYGLYLYFQ